MACQVLEETMKNPKKKILRRVSYGSRLQSIIGKINPNDHGPKTIGYHF